VFSVHTGHQNSKQNVMIFTCQSYSDKIMFPKLHNIGRRKYRNAPYRLIPGKRRIWCSWSVLRQNSMQPCRRTPTFSMNLLLQSSRLMGAEGRVVVRTKETVWLIGIMNRKYSCKGVGIISGTGAAIHTEIMWCNSRKYYWHILGISLQNFTQLGGSATLLHPFVWSHNAWWDFTSNFKQILGKVQWLDKRSEKKARAAHG
jgi:hypothetical protein